MVINDIVIVRHVDSQFVSIASRRGQVDSYDGLTPPGLGVVGGKPGCRIATLVNKYRPCFNTLAPDLYLVHYGINPHFPWLESSYIDARISASCYTI